MRISAKHTAGVGMLAALVVGTGEYLLHYDAQARFTAGGYDFLQGISATRSSLGHFFGVFGAGLYPIGCYHIFQMLRPANERWAWLAFLVSTFGFIVGAVWIGSRASVSALVQLPGYAETSTEVMQLIALYELRYESLLWVIRLTTLFLSIVFIWLTLTGRSRYPRWMALFSPIVLLAANFALFVWMPSIGKHTMPIALNVGFFVFFLLSFGVARRQT